MEHIGTKAFTSHEQEILGIVEAVHLLMNFGDFWHAFGFSKTQQGYLPSDKFCQNGNLVQSCSQHLTQIQSYIAATIHVNSREYIDGSIMLDNGSKASRAAWSSKQKLNN